MVAFSAAPRHRIQLVSLGARPTGERLTSGKESP